MIRSIDDNLPPAFVPLFLNRLGSLIAQTRAALSFLDKEDMGNFIDLLEQRLRTSSRN